MNEFPTAIEEIIAVVAIRRETTRSKLAYLVIGLLSVVALAITFFALSENQPLDDLLTGVFTPVVGIAGTVLGFYFGSQEGKP